MDPQSDNLFEVLTYLRDKGVEYFSNTSIMFKVTRHFLDDARAITLPIGTSRHLLGIFKEAMTNSLIHSNADELTFDSKVNQVTGGFEIILSDNGQGLKEKNTNKSTKGFHNMDIRAEKINAQLIIEKNQPLGLKVIVKYTPLFGGN
jgi:nitrate/nitrite-specific signal transduction histidine kinase